LTYLVSKFQENSSFICTNKTNESQTQTKMETKRAKPMERVTVPLPKDLSTFTEEELLAHPRRSEDVQRACKVLQTKPSATPLWLRAVQAGNLAVFLHAIGLAINKLMKVSDMTENDADLLWAFRAITFSALLKHGEKDWWEWPHDEDDEEIVEYLKVYRGNNEPDSDDEE
jgi:hypothetical protein